MLRLRASLLSVLVGAMSFALVAPASASCHEYIEGRCLENDVCAVMNKVRPTPCVD